MLTSLFISNVTTALSQVRNSSLYWLPSTKDKRVFSSWSRLKNKFASSLFFTWCSDRVNMIKNKLYQLESEIVVALRGAWHPITQLCRVRAQSEAKWSCLVFLSCQETVQEILQRFCL